MQKKKKGKEKRRWDRKEQELEREKPVSSRVTLSQETRDREKPRFLSFFSILPLTLILSITSFNRPEKDLKVVITLPSLSLSLSFGIRIKLSPVNAFFRVSWMVLCSSLSLPLLKQQQFPGMSEAL